MGEIANPELAKKLGDVGGEMPNDDATELASPPGAPVIAAGEVPSGIDDGLMDPSVFAGNDDAPLCVDTKIIC